MAVGNLIAFGIILFIAYKIGVLHSIVNALNNRAGTTPSSLSSSTSASTPTSKTTSTSAPAASFRNIPVTINGKSTTLIFDTGSTITTITPSLATSLGLGLNVKGITSNSNILTTKNTFTVTMSVNGSAPFSTQISIDPCCTLLCLKDAIKGPIFALKNQNSCSLAGQTIPYTPVPNSGGGIFATPNVTIQGKSFQLLLDTGNTTATALAQANIVSLGVSPIGAAQSNVQIGPTFQNTLQTYGPVQMTILGKTITTNIAGVTGSGLSQGGVAIGSLSTNDVLKAFSDICITPHGIKLV